LNLVFISDTRTITVALYDDDNQTCQDDSYVDMCKEILAFLRTTLARMVESFSWMKSLKFDFCIRCPICLGLSVCKKHQMQDSSQNSEASVSQPCYRDSCIHLIPEKDLLVKKPRCKKNPTKPNVIPLNTFSHWFSRSNDQVVRVQRELDLTCFYIFLTTRPAKVNLLYLNIQLFQ